MSSLSFYHYHFIPSSQMIFLVSECDITVAIDYFYAFLIMTRRVNFITIRTLIRSCSTTCRLFLCLEHILQFPHFLVPTELWSQYSISVVFELTISFDSYAFIFFAPRYLSTHRSYCIHLVFKFTLGSSAYNGAFSSHLHYAHPVLTFCIPYKVQYVCCTVSTTRLRFSNVIWASARWPLEENVC